jgi:peptidoglycan/xylan/chitin deacetylase (PgdA/CDA1 family)
MSIFGVAMALERNPQVVRAMVDDGHEIVSHGWRWIDYQNVPAEVERPSNWLAKVSPGLAGQAPVGWMTGRPSPPTATRFTLSPIG